LAVKVGAVALPFESVVTVALVRFPVNVPLAPLAAAVTVKVTETPGRRLPLLSFTMATKVENAVLTVALCGVPLVVAMVDGAVPVPLSEMLCGLFGSVASTI